MNKVSQNLAKSAVVAAMVMGSLFAALPASAAPAAAPTATEVSDKAPAGRTAAQSSAAAAYPYCTSWANQAKKNNSNEFAQIPISGSNFNCILERGNNSGAVRILQNHLNRCYGKGLTTDGVFGNGTYTALLQVQRQIGITADGVYGPGTRGAMNFFASDLTCNRITAYQGF